MKIPRLFWGSGNTQKFFPNKLMVIALFSFAKILDKEMSHRNVLFLEHRRHL